MQTPDNSQKNIEKIAALFPHVITETKDENGNIKIFHGVFFTLYFYRIRN